MEITITIIKLGLVLIISGILLNTWQPPIKPQYKFLILSLIGMGLSYLLKTEIIIGFIGAGLVFYKDTLVEEIKLVKESLLKIDKEAYNKEVVKK